MTLIGICFLQSTAEKEPPIARSGGDEGEDADVLEEALEALPHSRVRIRLQGGAEA